MGKKFEKDTLKKFLQLAVARIDVFRKKKSALNKKEMACVAALVAENKLDGAILRTEAICRDDMINEAYDIIRHNMDIIINRIALLESKMTCEQSILLPVTLLIWAESRIKPDIPEIDNIVRQFEYKFGKQFIMSMASTHLHMIPTKVYKTLTTIVPPAKIIDFYLTNICATFNVPYETPEELSMQIFSQNASNIINITPKDSYRETEDRDVKREKTVLLYESGELDVLADSRGKFKKMFSNNKSKENFIDVFDHSSDFNNSRSSNVDLHASLNTSTSTEEAFPRTLSSSAMHRKDYSNIVNNSKKSHVSINDDDEYLKKNSGNEDDEILEKKPYKGMHEADDEYGKNKPLKFVNDDQLGLPSYQSKYTGIIDETPLPPKYEPFQEIYIINDEKAKPSSHVMETKTSFDLLDSDDSHTHFQPATIFENQQIPSHMDEQIKLLEDKLSKLYPHKK